MQWPTGFCVYILYSPSANRYYIGQCADLKTRLIAHTDKSTPSTAHLDDWQLVFFETCSTRSEAMQLEQTIKHTKSRKSIQRFITNPANLCPTATHIKDAQAW